MAIQGDVGRSWDLMNITFRVDSSLDIGSGHVMRCLTLARFFRHLGCHCSFICRDHKGHLCNLISSEGFDLLMLPSPLTALGKNERRLDDTYARWLGVYPEEDFEECEYLLESRRPDWLIVDHYGLDVAWESAARKLAKKIMVIDDLSNRQHDCDILVDQTFGREPHEYVDKVPHTCRILVGSVFSILRPEFAGYRSSIASRNKESGIREILINLGGVDKDNLTCQVLEALSKCDLSDKYKVTVILGASSPWVDEVRSALQDSFEHPSLLIGVKNMAEVMSRADLAIGATGTTTWERCCVGLPSVTLVVAENQREISRRLHEYGAIIATDLSNLASEVVRLLNDPGELLMKVSEKALGVCDGQGVERIYDYLKLEN